MSRCHGYISVWHVNYTRWVEGINKLVHECQNDVFVCVCIDFVFVYCLFVTGINADLQEFVLPSSGPALSSINSVVSINQSVNVSISFSYRLCTDLIKSNQINQAIGE